MKKKRQLSLYTFQDRTRIEKHLEFMAKKGWILEKTGDFFWHYRRTEPQDLHFSVAYFPEATEFDPYPSEKQEIFRDFCEHAGWKFVASSSQMEIYCNASENPVPIETDAHTELEVIHKAAKKSFLPTYTSLLAVSLINIWNNTRSYFDDPLNSLLSNSALFWGLCLVLVALLCAESLISYLLWYQKAKRDIKLTDSLPPARSNHIFQKILLFICLGTIPLFLFQPGFDSSKHWMLSLLVIAVYFGLFLLILFLRNTLKKKGVSAENNRKITLISSIMLTTVALMAFVTLITNGFHSIPTGTAAHSRESILLERLDYEKTLSNQDGTDDLTIDYRITRVKFAPIYDYVFDCIYYKYDSDFYKEYYRDLTYHYDELDASIVNANKAYKLTVDYLDGKPQIYYLFCYDDHFVEIDTHYKEISLENLKVMGN